MLFHLFITAIKITHSSIFCKFRLSHKVCTKHSFVPIHACFQCKTYNCTILKKGRCEWWNQVWRFLFKIASLCSNNQAAQVGCWSKVTQSRKEIFKLDFIIHNDLSLKWCNRKFFVLLTLTTLEYALPSFWTLCSNFIMYYRQVKPPMW